MKHRQPGFSTFQFPVFSFKRRDKLCVFLGHYQPATKRQDLQWVKLYSHEHDALIFTQAVDIRPYVEGDELREEEVDKKFPSLRAEDIVSVQPMTAPTGLTFYTEYLNKPERR